MKKLPEVSLSLIITKQRNHRSTEHVAFPIKSFQAENNLISSLLQIALFNPCRVSLPFRVGARRGLIENCWFTSSRVFGTEMRQLLTTWWIFGKVVTKRATEVRRGRNFWVGLEFLMVWINGFDEGLGDC
jgi:hypothetical protein